MEDRLPRRPPFALAAFDILTAAATAIIAALAHSYPAYAIGLLALGGAALGALRVARATEIRTDQLVLQRPRQIPALDADPVTADLSLRPAAVRLSYRRLSQTAPTLTRRPGERWQLIITTAKWPPPDR